MAIRSFRRPDGRVVLSPATGSWSTAAARAAAQLVDSEALEGIVTIPSDASAARSALEAVGFRVEREETVVEIDPVVALAALAGSSLPPDLVVRRADQVSDDELRALDDELRRDVPGTDGWTSSPEQFRSHTYEDPGFDPATYLVAVDLTYDRPIGLVRIWMNPRGPRVGLWGVRRPYRRRGIAAALLHVTLAAAAARDPRPVTTEFDMRNDASAALARRVDARESGRILELRRRPGSVRRSPSIR